MSLCSEFLRLDEAQIMARLDHGSQLTMMFGTYGPISWQPVSHLNDYGTRTGNLEQNEQNGYSILTSYTLS